MFRFGPLAVDVVLLVTLHVVFSFAIDAQTKGPAQEFRAPGKMIDIGGSRLHINCQGKARRGSPTVVFESGAGDFSFDWALVQPEVAKFTRACTYDRAGYAWSTPGRMPRTMHQIAAELHRGLTKAGAKGPLVLVGHSLGGLIVRVFAQEYPTEVVGMVLVDSSHEDNQMMLNGKLVLLRDTSRGRAIPTVQLTPPAVSDKANQNDPPTVAPASKVDPPFDKLPPKIQQVRLWAMAQPSYNVARSSEFDYLAEEVTLMHNDRARSEYPLGDMPLVVLTRGKNVSQNHKKLQADLVRLSRNGKQLIAEKSDHHIQIDDPQFVIDAVLEVVDGAKRAEGTRAKRAP